MLGLPYAELVQHGYDPYEELNRVLDIQQKTTGKKVEDGFVQTAACTRPGTFMSRAKAQEFAARMGITHDADADSLDMDDVVEAITAIKP